MPPKTRSTNTKENINKKLKNDLQDCKTKQPRKPLGDKTNSASDDNSLSVVKPVRKNIENIQNDGESEIKVRRRIRGPPKRFINNNTIKDSSNLISENMRSTTKESPHKKALQIESKVTENPNEYTETPLVNTRPKRIHRLPKKFDGHALSPKYSPIKPVQASTPIPEKPKENRSKVNLKIEVKESKEYNSKNLSKSDHKRKLISDSNNNNGQSQDSVINLQKSPNPTKLVQNKLKRTISKLKQVPSKNISLRVLDDRNKSLKSDDSKLDVYEFTFDPNEEPPPKKKKKKPIKRNPTKPKTVTFKSNYDKNLAKALAALKNTVAVKSSQRKQELVSEKSKSQENNTQGTTQKSIVQEPAVSRVDSIHENVHNSVRVEDIALQFQEDNHDINYSPINSPGTGRDSPVHQNMGIEPPQPVDPDPLNLNEDLSFFDDPPVASSSMNTSKHPLASPWRVEFNDLPIKWKVNTYVKPNMTPSVDTSFINFNESKKKHVYTNIMQDDDEVAPAIQEDAPSLKQTSILSFIKEMVEKKAKKKKTFAENNVFNDIPSRASTHITPVKNNSLNESLSPIEEVTPENIEREDSHVLREKQNIEVHSFEKNALGTKTKDSAKKKNKDRTYFGFDDSEDQENISPLKRNHKAKNLRLRSHKILKEINGAENSGKVVTPLTAKSDALVNAGKLFDELKSATEPPLFPDAHVEGDSRIRDISEPELPNNIENEDSQSVHLFEDIEVVHHAKQNRKSYSKTKKVTFRKNSHAESNSDDEGAQDYSDNTDDESFRIPSIKQKRVIKKKKNKPKLSKKQEQEVEAWAAGFNSMCEDIEEFDLLVE